MTLEERFPGREKQIQLFRNIFSGVKCNLSCFCCLVFLFLLTKECRTKKSLLSSRKVFLSVVNPQQEKVVF